MKASPGQTKSCLKVLHLEDDPLDAELIRYQLENCAIPCSITQIHNEKELQAALNDGKVDVILSDSSLPCFDTFTALDMVKKRRPEVPFIFVSGTFSPAVKTRAVERGATDFISKDNLALLPIAVCRVCFEEKASREESLPERGHPVVVRCKEFRCLGFLDKYDVWRDFHTGMELSDVLEWIKL